MWKWTSKDETKPGPSIPSAAPPVHSVPSHIGKLIAIKGEVSGSESVYWDGKLEGSVELLDGSLTIVPDARIRANLRARSIVIQGRVDGNMYGLEHVELKKSAIFVGDIFTPRIAIEDGAVLEGNVRIHRTSPVPKQRNRMTRPPRNSSDSPSYAQ
jgi:cytoskeletal protein CcmA (bactofilin family)